MISDGGLSFGLLALVLLTIAWTVVTGLLHGHIAQAFAFPAGAFRVDGAMIGAFSAFGIAPALAVVSVLVYRGLAFWLPTLPGAVAYLQLRRTVHRWRSEASPSYT